MPALMEPDVAELKAKAQTVAVPCSTAPRNNHHKPLQPTSWRIFKSACWVLLVLGVVWRGWQLDRIPEVNGDEAWYGVQAQRFLDELIHGKALPRDEQVNFRTPTGNVWNPFLMIPRLALDASVAPSVWSLRLPALISGLLALLVNWWLCRLAFDRKMAWLTTALLAVLPMAVIYSRLAWDSCQSIFCCLPLVYLPWIAERRQVSSSRSTGYVILALAAALLVHPTNIFLLPVSLVLFWPRLCQALKLDLSLRSRLALCLGAMGTALGIGISRGVWAGVEVANVGAAVAQWACDVLALFDGAAVYGSISLPAEELPSAQRWLLLGSVPAAALLMAARFSCKTAIFLASGSSFAQRYAMLFDGTGFALLCFLGVAGPGAIQPGYERYGLWVVAPGVLLIVMAYRIIACRSRGAFRVVTSIAIVQLAVLLGGYWHYYQQRFELPAAQQQLAHWTYQADSFDAWEDIVHKMEQQDRGTDESTRKLIVVLKNDPQRWWFEWKWRYLSHGSNSEWIVVNTLDEIQACNKPGVSCWLMASQPANAKEKISIRYMPN